MLYKIVFVLLIKFFFCFTNKKNGCVNCVTQTSCFHYTVCVCRVSTHCEENVVNMCSQSRNSKLPSSRGIIYNSKSNKPASPRHHPSIMIFFCILFAPPDSWAPCSRKKQHLSSIHLPFFLTPSWKTGGADSQVGHLKLKSSFIDAGTQRNGVQHCQRQPCEVVRKNPEVMNSLFVYVFISTLNVSSCFVLFLFSFSFEKLPPNAGCWDFQPSLHVAAAHS